MAWDKNSRGVTCKIVFLGGRSEGTVLYGDNERFWVPIEGEARELRDAE